MNKTWPLSSKSRNPATRSHTRYPTQLRPYPGFYMPLVGNNNNIHSHQYTFFLVGPRTGRFPNTNSFNSYTSPVRYSIITGPSILQLGELTHGDAQELAQWGHS